ncbi:DUF4328 domain-containing protein [Streptacidiphilus carbonis]|uniref:DUF4328 domain-containing protein n=1 Tax=Streptacidiphilus carbonis TaxID=105422 RepID=UPI0005AAEB70|nr:DUF4328 domain-containing protein [Streptacidiphilus carbonis]
MPCPSCSSPYLDPYGRCSACGWAGAQPSAYYPVAYSVPSAPTGLATAVQILFGANLLVAALFIGLDGYGMSLSHAIGADGAGSHWDAASATLVASSLLFDLGGLLLLGTAVTFIVWFFKSAKLSGVLAPGQQRLGPGWAVGGWFVPVAFLVLPRMVAGDIWRASEPLTEERLWKPRSRLVTFWWLTFAIGLVCFWASVLPIQLVSGNRVVDGTESISSAWFVFAFAVEALWVASSVLGVLMVRRLTSRQQIRIMQGPGAGHPFSMAAAMRAQAFAPPVHQQPQIMVPPPAPTPVADEPAVVLAKAPAEPEPVDPEPAAAE